MTQRATRSPATTAAPVEPAFPVLMRIPRMVPAVSIAVATPKQVEKEAALSSSEPAVNPKSQAAILQAAIAMATQTTPTSDPESTVPEKTVATTTTQSTESAPSQPTAAAAKADEAQATIEKPTPAEKALSRSEARRRAHEQSKAKQSWWNTHFPVIAIVFVVALGVTLMLARRNKSQSTANDVADAQVPELNIEIGGSNDASPVSIETPRVAEATSASPLLKTPSLLSAGPQTAEPSGTDPKPANVASAEPVVDSIKPSNTETKEESTTVAKPTTPVEPDPSIGPELNSPYPTTDPSVYRTGGRAPRVQPNEPATNDINSWR